MLHTINKSPFGSNSFQTSVRFLQPGDPVLFIEDGVYGVQANNKFSDLIRGGVAGSSFSSFTVGFRKVLCLCFYIYVFI